MYKTKGLITGAILLIMVFTLGNIGLACGAPAHPLPKEIHADFINYTDESNLFSISYPSDWKMVEIADIDKNTQEITNNLKADSTVDKPYQLLIGGLETATGYDPILDIVVDPIRIAAEPIHGPKLEIETGLDEEVEAEITGIKMLYLQDLKEFSRATTIINGREATIINFEGTPSGKNKRHYLMMVTMAGKTVWRVTCSSKLKDFATWENDFDTIVRSLQIYY
jgi:hypothetical protein